MCKKHYGNEITDTLQKYGTQKCIYLNLHIMMIENLANIVISYLQTKICEGCIKSIKYISPNLSFIIYDEASGKYYLTPNYKILFFNMGPTQNYISYTAPKITYNDTPQIIKQEPIIKYKIRGNKNKVTCIDRKQKSGKIFKKSRPLGYKNLQYNFNMSEYETYFEKDLCVQHTDSDNRNQNCNSNYDSDYDY